MGQIASRQAELEALHREIFGNAEEVKPQAAKPAEPLTVDDGRLLDIAFQSAKGEAIRSLWAGHIPHVNGKPDHSAADQSLANHLVYWTQGDLTRADRLFRQSGLYRPKWDERRGKGTYGEMTLEKAAKTAPYYYDPSYRSNGNGTNGNHAPREEEFHTSGADEPPLFDDLPVVNPDTGELIYLGGMPSISLAGTVTASSGSKEPPSMEGYPNAPAQVEEKREPVFRGLDFTALMQMKPKEWQIEGVMGKGEVGMTFGGPGEGKTFTAIDKALCAVLGRPWAGQFAIPRPLTVGYCAGEGASGLKARFEAAALRYSATAEDLAGLVVFGDVPQLFEQNLETNVWQFILDYKESGRPPLDLLIIDTLHSATIGAEENSAKDAGKIIAAARLLTRELGCTVEFIHHSNKAGTGDRGSSAFRGAMDFMLEVKSIYGIKKVLECSKIKDAPPFEPQTFTLVAKGDSVYPLWDGPISEKTESKEDGYREKMMEVLCTYQGKRFTAKTLGEAAGISAPHATKLLTRMYDIGDICRDLTDPQKSNSPHNPWVYFVDGED